jgi:type IV pilus assembly protein PilQ
MKWIPKTLMALACSIAVMVSLLVFPCLAATEPVAVSPDKPVAPKTARTLTDVSVKNNTIVLTVTGGASDFTSFRLNKPERFIIDIPGAVSLLPSRVIPLNVSGVASARIGMYPEKVRIVLDSVDGSFPEVTAVPSPDGVVVSLIVKENVNPNTKLVAAKTAKEPVAEVKPVDKTKPVSAEPAKPVNTEKPAYKAGVKPEKYVSGLPAKVEMIDFQVVENISRVAIKVKGDVSVEPPSNSPGFVTLTVKNATIAKQLQRSLEARSFVSPVLRVTPIVVKAKKGSDIKIRIAMRATAPYDFKQEGDMLFVDFTNPPGQPADKSASDAKVLKQVNAKATKTAASKTTDINAELVNSNAVVSTTATTGKIYTGRKVTLEFADAEVRKIFQLLAEVSGKNFVLGDEVTGAISLKLVNVPWDQALDIISESKNYDIKENGNVLTIKGKEKLKTQDALESELKKIVEKNLPLQPAKVFNVNYGSVEDVFKQVEKLSSGPNGVKLRTDTSAVFDKRSSKIIVVDTADRLKLMQALLNEIDVPERQVMIEARIVEASSTFTKTLGVAWGAHVSSPIPMWGIKEFSSGFGGVAATTPPASGNPGEKAGGSMGITFGSLFGTALSLDMRLNAAASANLIKIISTPKVATLNNLEAVIKQGQNYPYQGICTTTSGATYACTQFILANLELTITPHINKNDTIGLKIKASNNSLGATPAGGTVPALNTKEATTEMLLKDGDTTVIGGIFVDAEADDENGVPFLMDVPLLGNLFKSSVKNKVKNEMLIFITPKILTAI